MGVSTLSVGDFNCFICIFIIFFLNYDRLVDYDCFYIFFKCFETEIVLKFQI